MDLPLLDQLHGNLWTRKGVVIEPKEPWEGASIQNFFSPAEILPDGRWRIWYSAAGGAVRFHVATAEGLPGRPMRKQPAMLSSGEPAPGNPLAIGGLPQGWRPVQVVHLELPDGRHRLYFWAHGPDVVRYLAADSADGKQYRVMNSSAPCLYHPHDRAVSFNDLPDGLTIGGNRDRQRPDGERPAGRELICNDATNVYLLPDGTFELYTVALVPVPPGDSRFIAHDNAAGVIRVIDRLASKDGLHWGGRTRVIEPHPDDPPDLQFYYLGVTHTPAGRIGMLGHYRAGAQTMDIEWCHSQDGLRWERPFRKPGFARPEEGPDCYGVYAPHALVFRDGKAHLFYTGTNSAHNHRDSRGKPRTVIMLAEQPLPSDLSGLLC